MFLRPWPRTARGPHAAQPLRPHPLPRGRGRRARWAQGVRGGQSAAPAVAGLSAPSWSAGTERFAGVQRRLALSYAAIFCVTLLLLGPVLYLSFSSQSEPGVGSRFSVLLPLALNTDLSSGPSPP
jgi:hypothetical protein